MSIKVYELDGKKFYEVYVACRQPNGKRLQGRKRNIETLHQARQIEFELKRQFANKKENPCYNWEEWFEECINKMRVEFRPSTLMNYEFQLKKWTHPVWRKRLIAEITPMDVHHFIYEVVHDVSPNARKTILKMTKRIFQMAMDEGILDRNPATKVKVKVPEVKQAVLNASEVEILLRQAKNHGHKFYEIWAVALMTGMRSGELYALKWSDVDFENRRITVSQSWCSKNGFGPTKNAKTRIVPVCNELDGLLKSMKLKNPQGYEHVLPHLREWIRGEQAEVLKEFCLGVGITPVKFHDLRATFITQLLLKGVSLAHVMTIVGHSQIKTTNQYLRMTGAELEGVTNKLGFQLPPDNAATVISLWQK